MKKEMKNNRLKFLLIGFLLIIMSGVLVSAFTVGFESNQLYLTPGEVYDSTFSLQNYGADSVDVTVEAVVKEGSEYVSFAQGNTFEVLGKGGLTVPVTFTVPEDAKIGDDYLIKILFKSVAGGSAEGVGVGGASVGFVVNRERDISIEVVPKPGEEEGISTMWIILGIIAVLILIAIIWFVVKSKKEVVPVKK